MARVLLAWELGAGFGHLMALAHIARTLVPEHQVTLALPAVDEGALFFRDLPVRVRPACTFDTRETLPLRAGRRFSARDYGDILAFQGFAEAATLAPQLAAWDALLREVDPHLVVADGSPALCLAARGRVPTIATGAGFAVPPTHLGAFPVLQPQRAPLVSAEALLDNIQRVLTERGQPVADSLPAQLQVEAHLARTLPELDPYRTTRSSPAAGPLQPLLSVQPSAPARSFVMYVGTRSPFRLLFQALQALCYQGTAFVRGLAHHDVLALRSQGLAISAEPLALAEHLARVNLVIHYGGLNLASEALTAGRPQLLFPLHLEQALTARALSELGVGLAWPWRREVSLEQAAQAIEQASGLASAARQRAHQVQRPQAAHTWQRTFTALGVPVAQPEHPEPASACAE